jgi:hypothetical protein
MSRQLVYIKHEDIDELKWAKCIENADNSRIYANIWHLDRAAVVWDALVLGDYEFVMPLPVRKKLGLKYVYQPIFCQQLGIFPKPDSKITTHFFTALLQHFQYADVYINSSNQKFKETESIQFIPRQNYLLDLQYNYKSIARNYSKNTKRNIAKANKNELQLIAGIRLEEYMAFKLANLKNSSKKNTEKLKSIIAFGQYKGLGEIYGVYDKENVLCAAVYFTRWKNRIIYLNAVSNQLGKDLRAMHFLLDNFIKNNAGHDRLLDFEGSMIPGVARFYSGFGASPETYFQLKFNRLPLPFRWLKS